jgi:DNA-binding CsgD family transcriptional regulator
VATVSRSKERNAVDDLLSSADVQPSGLVIAGEPGIGKTTLWLAGVARARDRGFQVLSTRADEAESVLSYAAIADLMADVDPEVFDALPELQRVAVDRVLLRGGSEGPPTDQRVTASAVAAIVSALAATQPVLLAIDDAQWLDVSSQAVLAFAARRLSGRVGILLTGRAHSAEADPAGWLQLKTPDAVTRLRVRPLSLGAMHAMIFERFGKAFPRPTMVRIAEISGGNPFYALELARAVEGRTTTAETVLPSTLAELVRLRTGHFSGEVGDMLLAACSVTDATVDLLASATGVSIDRVVDLLEGPEREGIVRIDGNRVTFAHPLLARGIYTQAGPARRRRMHRTLAAVEEQPELKARHMALGAASADPDTLSALDRGAAAAAADLYGLAIGLGGATPARRLNAAEQHLRSGDTRRAATMLEAAVAEFGPGPLRATALTLLGSTRMAEHDFAGALGPLTEAAHDAGEDLDLLVRAQLALSRAQTMTGQHDEARRHAELAVSNAEELGTPKLISQALAMHVLLTCSHGVGRDEVALARALELEVPDPDVGAPFRASATDAITLGWTGRLDEALAGLIAARRWCVEIGSDADQVYVTGHLAMVYVWLGRYSVAVELADDILRRGDHLGGGYPMVIARTQRAVASSYLGRERATREDAKAAIAGARQCGAQFLTVWPLMTLGFLEVSLGNFAQALNALEPLLSGGAGSNREDLLPASYLADAIEAMVAVGRLDDAVPLVESLEGSGAQLDRPWMLAVGARGRSMLLAAQGELAASEETLYRAMAQHDRLPMPFERARTQLFLGQVLRRQRRKNLAATTLREALVTFEELGTPLWAERVRAELKRIDAPRTNTSDLTPSELRVARLAASGMTNKDIASALFISPKTVEHNLSSVYRKLAVRTRAELARRAAELGED